PARSTSGGARGPATPPRGPADSGAPATRSRSAVTTRAASASEVPGSRQAYSAPAPAGPLTAGLTPAAAPATATASSTAPSALTQNDTRTTVLARGDAPPRPPRRGTESGSAPQRAGAVSATATAPPGAARSAAIC